jgi:tRNA pseudouridine55 synthase
VDETLYIDKPADMTSFGVVARVRRVLTDEVRRSLGPDEPRRAKVKVGHTGTLDPFATGLMILLIGKGTKRSDEFLKLDKVYEATIRLGQVSSTGDSEGEVTDVSSREPTSSEIQAALEQFTGEIQQIPPMYSAIKIGGQRAYKLARMGETVEMPTRTVHIYSLELVDYSYPELRIRTHVSSGTYIRTLAEDIGRTLEVGAYCTALRRTRIGTIDISEAQPLDDFMKSKGAES